MQTLLSSTVNLLFPFSQRWPVCGDTIFERWDTDIKLALCTLKETKKQSEVLARSVNVYKMSIGLKYGADSDFSKTP